MFNLGNSGGKTPEKVLGGPSWWCWSWVLVETPKPPALSQSFLSQDVDSCPAAGLLDKYRPQPYQVALIKSQQVTNPC